MVKEAEELDDRYTARHIEHSSIPSVPENANLFEIYNIQWFLEREALHLRFREVGDKTNTEEFECTLLYMEKLDGRWFMVVEGGRKIADKVLLEVGDDTYLKKVDDETFSKVVKRVKTAMADLDDKTSARNYRPHLEEVFGLKFDPTGWYETEHDTVKKRLKVKKLKAIFKRPKDYWNDDY